jgi:hypothetical protein
MVPDRMTSWVCEDGSMDNLHDRGICYCVDGIMRGSVQNDLKVISQELHCTAVTLIASRSADLVEAARYALDLGLRVYMRPQVADARRQHLADHTRTVAAEAEVLRQQYGDRVTMVLGTELSLTSRVVVPVRSEYLRLQIILRLGRFFMNRITRRVNALVTDLAHVARQEFHGPVTYAAAYWERMDWTDLDLVGVNLYRMGDDGDGYSQRLRSLVQSAGKEVVITEFGCGAHIGAEERGPGAFFIVNWFADPPRVRRGHVRDESTQARYLRELIDLYTVSGVHGCFVFTFAMPDFPFHTDPQLDLDMAGLGVVKTVPGSPDRWIRKEAFHAIADRYALLTRRDGEASPD